MPPKTQTGAPKKTAPQVTQKKLSKFSREARGIPTDYSIKSSWVFETIDSKPASMLIKNDKSLKGKDPVKEKIRSMRYCTDQDTIWVDEQDTLVNKGTVEIEDGVLVVSPDEIVLLDFLFFHEKYGVDFIVRDNEARAKEQNEIRKKRNDAINKVYDEDMSILRPIAVVEQISLDEGEEAVRNYLAEKAEKNPEKFLDMFNNDFVKIHATVLEARNADVLDFNSPDDIKWTDNGGRILTIPHGQDHAIVLAKRLAAGELSDVLVKLRQETEI